MKYTANDIRKAETRKIDISEYFKDEKKVYLTIRRFSNHQQNELVGIMTAGQEIKMKSKEIEEQFVKMSNAWLPEYRAKQLLYGVDAKTDDFPFEKWDESFINEIDEINPDLISFIQGEVEDFNAPLAKEK